MSLITSLGHAYAVAIADIKKAGRVVMSDVLPILKKLEADAPTIEAVTGIVSPQLANIERVGEAALGVIIQAIEDAGAASNAGGLSISLDAALVADIKAIIPTVKTQAAALLPAVPAKA